MEILHSSMEHGMTPGGLSVNILPPGVTTIDRSAGTGDVPTVLHPNTLVDLLNGDDTKAAHYFSQSLLRIVGDYAYVGQDRALVAFDRYRIRETLGKYAEFTADVEFLSERHSAVLDSSIAFIQVSADRVAGRSACLLQLELECSSKPAGFTHVSRGEADRRTELNVDSIDIRGYCAHTGRILNDHQGELFQRCLYEDVTKFVSSWHEAHDSLDVHGCFQPSYVRYRQAFLFPTNPQDLLYIFDPSKTHLTVLFRGL